LPRLASALNKPAIATALGLVLVAVAIIGMVTGDIGTGWAIIILVIGAINVLRAIPTERGRTSAGEGRRAAARPRSRSGRLALSRDLLE
jgi:hypothetical protein